MEIQLDENIIEKVSEIALKENLSVEELIEKIIIYYCGLDVGSYE